MPPSDPTRHSPTARGIGFMLLAVLLFTAMDAVAKELVGRYPTGLVVWARFAGQLVIVLLVLGRATPRLLETDFPGLHILRAVTQLATATLFFASLPYIGLLDAQALADTSPVLITLGAALFLGEKIGVRRAFGVLAALIGALIILRPGTGVFTPAALLPLAAAVTYAANVLLTRSIGMRETPATAMLYGSLICTGLSTLALPFGWAPVASADLPLFAVAGALGAGAQWAIIRAYSLAEASVVAPFTYAGIVTAALWGWLVFGEVPDAATLAGALVIGAAGLYVWHRETRARTGGL